MTDLADTAMTDAATVETTTPDATPAPPHPDGEDLCGDAGLRKKILREGTGSATPPKGAEVQVHYVGKLLDGTVFDSSRERGEFFSFKIGQGQVIKGWDKGVKTMKKGELAILTCAPDYAYGESGSPPKIPPMATLQFEVELFSWESDQDVSNEKDRSVMKSVLREGEGYDTPAEDVTVTVNYEGKLEDGTVFDKKTAFSFLVGEENVVAGLERAIETMKKNEHASVRVAAKHAFGAAGNAELGVSANANVVYEVELVDFDKPKKNWEMESDEKLEAARVRKDRGNEFFKLGKFALAIKKYKRALSFIEYDTQFSDTEKESSKQLKLQCALNSAACLLKTRDFKAVLEQTKKVLDIEPKNVKGLFRQACAYVEMGEWAVAKKELARVLEIDPKNVDAKRELVKVQQRIKEQNEADKKKFGGMFAKFSAQDALLAKAKPEAEAAPSTSETTP